MLNRVLVLEALFGFTIAIVFYSGTSYSYSGSAATPVDHSRPRMAQVRVMFDDPVPGQHRPVVVKRAGKACHKSEAKGANAKLDGRNEIVERHVGQCHKAEIARRLEERRHELESEQITPVTPVSARP